MSTLREHIIEEHINKNYPNSHILNYNDADSDLVFYSSDELQSVDEDWFPLCCYKNNETGKAVYGGRKGVFHTYTEGETGAGKTTRFVMQSILALSSMRIKPSFVIVDIHGEIIENLYNHLKQNGYNIKILNCDSPERSDTYNPFYELAKECVKTGSISNDTINKIRRIAEIIQPVESSTDPIWDKGARAYTNGAILDKFEDLINGDLPEECLTIYNVIQNHYWLRESLTKDYGNDLFRIPHYRKKGAKALSVQKMMAVTNNAEKTRASYFGVVENHYDTFGQPSLYSLSSDNTIDIADFIENPTAIVIQSGTTRIGDDLISLLLNEIYTNVVKIGKASRSKRLPRNIHCFLDEFANCNIADGPEYIRMLTTSRKFGMFWHMILQCDAQLDRKYDQYIGRIIRANSTEIFMGSHDYETEVRFAKSCGQKTIESLASVAVQQDPHLDVVDLMTAEKLNLTERGYAYVKSNRHPLTLTYFEAFYNCNEFAPVDDIDTVYPYNGFDYRQTAFYPDDLPPDVTNSEFELLKYIKAGERSLKEITDAFPDCDIKIVIKSLAEKGAVKLLDNHMVRSNITERQYDLYIRRDASGLYDGDGSRLSTTPQRQDRSDADFLREQNNSQKIDNWLSDDSASKNALFEDLKAHLKNLDIEDILRKLKKVTVVPVFLRNAVECIGGLKEDFEQPELDFPENPNIFKFEIIEEFIRNNNFNTKELWISKMREECKYLTVENIFPESIMSEFRKAFDEIKKDLTLSNIREIKKIISDNP